MHITATLNELEFLMSSVHPPAFLQIGNGMPLDDIRRTVKAYEPLLQPAGIDFPFELIELFHWHNGSNREENVGAVELLNLEEAMATWQALVTAIDTEFTVENWYFPSWIPFAKVYSDWFLCIDAAGVAGGPRGQIVEFRRDNPTRVISALSMREWFEEVVENYEDEEPIRENGIAFGDEGEDGLWDYDPDDAPEGPNCYIRHFEAGA